MNDTLESLHHKLKNIVFCTTGHKLTIEGLAIIIAEYEKARSCN